MFAIEEQKRINYFFTFLIIRFLWYGRNNETHREHQQLPKNF